MCRRQYLNQMSVMIAVMLISTSVAADHIKPTKATPTVAAIAASLSTTLEVLIPRVITPADSGILVSIGRSDQADFTIAKSNSGTNHELIGGKSEGDLGASLGYRKALNSRWSIDTQYERQRARRVMATSGNTAQSEQVVQSIIAHWAGVTGLYHAPITPKVSVHAGAGAFVWQRESESNLGNDTKETGADLMLQVGIGYRVVPRAKVEANVQRFFMPDKAIDRMSLGVVINTD